MHAGNFDMWLENRDGCSFLFVVGAESITECRRVWRAIAGVSADQHLQCFRVYEFNGRDNGKLVYEGSYVTDEC